MIDLTVKTLDSQNHTFSLNDDITVRQFKEHIAGTVSIPADLQRLIYCGRVLQDEKNLNEYDVNGKVIHLVQRAPPNLGPRPNNDGPSQSHSSNPGPWQSGHRIHYRQTQFHGNPMYVGSVSIPADVLEWPSPPSSSSLVNGHLRVVRRMLDQANRVMGRLENPIDTPAGPRLDQSSSNGASETTSPAEDVSSTGVSGNPPLTQEQAQEPAGSSDDSTESLVPRQLAELLEELLTTQDRLRPFIRDRILSSTSTNAGENQRLIDGVSECFHFLSHAQHALSDISIDMQQPPPRTLRCRPMILQPSAIVQAGLPIQVEAHISLRGQSDNNNTDNEAPATQTSTTSTESTAPPTESTSERPQNPNRPESERFGPADSPFGGFFNLPNVEVVMEMGTQIPRIWSFSSSESSSGNNNNNNNNTNNNNTNASNNNNSNTGTATGGPGTSVFSWTTAPSPDVLRNLMQAVAGYMVQTGVPMPAPSTAPTTSAPTNPTGGCPRHRGRTGDSASAQTRASTDTHPTTSTQTRTTSRTHVFHQPPEALGVGVNMGHSTDFDPFLHCNSQHMRRQSQTSTVASTQTGQPAATTDGQTQGTTASSTGPRFATITGVQILNSNVSGRGLAHAINMADRSDRPEHAVSFNNFFRNFGIHLAANYDVIPARRRTMLQRIYVVMSSLSVADWLKIVRGDYTPLTLQLQERLRATIEEAFPDGDVANWPSLVAEAVRKELRNYLDEACNGAVAMAPGTMRVVAIRETIGAQLALQIQNIVRCIYTTYDTNTAFAEVLMKHIKALVSNIVGLCRMTLRDRQDGFERVATRFASLMTRGTPDELREWILFTVVQGICRHCRSVEAPPTEALAQMLVYEDRRSVARPVPSCATASQASSTTSTQSSQSSQDAQTIPEAMETDSGPDPLVVDDNEEVSTTFPGSENILPDWVPIIARDGARQRRQLQLGLSGGSVTTLSDAYLATMPSKRRKLVEQQKPTLLASPTPNNSAIPASMERLIRESVERAGVEEVDGAAAAVASDSTVRRAFGEAVRECLHPQRYETPDFPDPRRFPNATKFFSDHDRHDKQ